MIEFIKEALKKLDLIKSSVAVGSLLLLSFLTYALVYVPIPEGNKEALLILLGAVTGIVVSIAGFYFGSSKGSQMKNDMLDKTINNIKPQ